MKPHTILLHIGCLILSITPAPGAEPVQFYRVASTQMTRIISFKTDGTLSFSNSVSNAVCRIERSGSASATSWATSRPVMWVRATNKTQSIAMPAIPTNKFLLQGTVAYQNIEGGFYGIIGPLGEHYDPINLPARLAINGTTISNDARVCVNQVSTHQWGTLIELILSDPWIVE